jgi:hypothetical protein
MTVTKLTVEMSSLMALPESDLIRKGLLALAEKEIRLAEEEIARIRERYDVFSQEALYGAIRDGRVPGHPAWECTPAAPMSHLYRQVACGVIFFRLLTACRIAMLGCTQML